MRANHQDGIHTSMAFDEGLSCAASGSIAHPLGGANPAGMCLCISVAHSFADVPSPTCGYRMTGCFTGEGDRRPAALAVAWTSSIGGTDAPSACQPGRSALASSRCPGP